MPRIPAAKLRGQLRPSAPASAVADSAESGCIRLDRFIIRRKPARRGAPARCQHLVLHLSDACKRSYRCPADAAEIIRLRALTSSCRLRLSSCPSRSTDLSILASRWHQAGIESLCRLRRPGCYLVLREHSRGCWRVGQRPRSSWLRTVKLASGRPDWRDRRLARTRRNRRNTTAVDRRDRPVAVGRGPGEIGQRARHWLAGFIRQNCEARWLKADQSQPLKRVPS